MYLFLIYTPPFYLQRDTQDSEKGCDLGESENHCTDPFRPVISTLLEESPQGKTRWYIFFLKKQIVATQSNSVLMLLFDSWEEKKLPRVLIHSGTLVEAKD